MQRDYCRDMRDHWKHSFIRIRKRFLAAGAGAVLLAGTILPPVTAVSAGLQDVRTGTTENVTDQAGGQADAGTSGASSAQTDPAAITDGNSAQSSDAGLSDGIDISGSSSGDGSTSESSALQQGSGQESGSLQQGSSADPGTGTAGSENVPSGGIQNGAAPSRSSLSRIQSLSQMRRRSRSSERQTTASMSCPGRRFSSGSTRRKRRRSGMPGAGTIRRYRTAGTWNLMKPNSRLRSLRAFSRA